MVWRRGDAVYFGSSSLLPASTFMLQLITILKRCQRFPRFVYRQARFSSDHKSIQIEVRPQKAQRRFVCAVMSPLPDTTNSPSAVSSSYLSGAFWFLCCTPCGASIVVAARRSWLRKFCGATGNVRSAGITTLSTERPFPVHRVLLPFTHSSGPFPPATPSLQQGSAAALSIALLLPRATVRFAPPVARALSPGFGSFRFAPSKKIAYAIR
jgi:hypothetical protein